MLKLIVSLIFICVIKCTTILDVWSVKQKQNYLMEYQKKEHDPRRHCDKYMCNPKLKLHCRS